jgi:acyl carrier protein
LERAEDPTVRTQELATLLRDRLSILLDRDAASIRQDTDFGDLGVDSMMRLELIALVEQHVGYELPERDLLALTTIDRVIDYVSTQGQ